VDESGLIRLVSGWILIGLGVLLVLGWAFDEDATNPQALLIIGVLGVGSGAAFVYLNRPREG